MANQATIAMNEAWIRYRREVDDVRELMLSQSWAADVQVRARVEYALQEVQAVAYNQIISPRPDYPNLYKHFQPIVYSCMMHPADFLNRRCFLDGRRTYRIWGKRNSSLFVDFQVINVYYGEANAKNIGNWDLDNFTIEPDGSFEIIVSAMPHSGNWIKLDPSTTDRNFINIREAFGDLEREKGVEMHIERISDDVPARPIEWDEPALIARLERAGRFVHFALDDWAVKLNNDILNNVGRNEIYDRSFAGNQGGGNNPSAIYPTALWHLAPDEALILESEIPNAKYWNAQLGDICWRVLDYAYHHTSINGHQARLDRDGRFRGVIAHSDPGIANWLDTLGNTQGILIFRFYRFDRQVMPKVWKVKLKELWQHLPEDTHRMTPDERVAVQRARTQAVRARYQE
jgi:hypothetical protein